MQLDPSRLQLVIRASVFLLVLQLKFVAAHEEEVPADKLFHEDHESQINDERTSLVVDNLQCL